MLNSSGATMLFFAAALTVAACAPEVGPSVQRFEEDGVVVVSSERPAWAEGEQWRLTPEPTLVIGENTDDPRYLFGALYEGRFLGVGNGLGPFRLPDGGIVAGDALTVELRFFDSGGELLRTTIGPGEGPQELTRLNQLHHCIPGTLFAIDGGLDLLAVIDDKGEFRDRYFFEDNAGTSMYTPLACNRSGQLLGMDWGRELSDPTTRAFGSYRSRAHIWLLDQEGFVIRDLGEFPGVDRIGTEGGSGPHPFGKTTQRALAEDRVFIGTADEFEVQVWSFDAVLLERWRRPTGDRTVRQGDLDAYVEEDPESELAEEIRYYERTMPELPLPENYPAYSRFLIGARGSLWVENYRPFDRGDHLWSVFAPDGVWLGEVEVPATFQITDIGEDYVLGVFLDELDEQSIRMYGLRRGAG